MTAGVATVAASTVVRGVASAAGVASFSWRDVAVDGITAGITAGAASYLTGTAKFGKLAADGSRMLNTGGRVVQGLASYGGSVVANAAVGRDANFSWKAVAATAAGAYIGGKINPSGSLPITDGSTGFERFVNDFASSALDGAITATARRTMGLGEQNWGQIAVDAFGNALANSSIRGIQNARALSALSPDQRARYDRMVENGVPARDALSYATQTAGRLPAYLMAQPLSAEQSATRFEDLKNLQFALTAAGRNSRTVRSEAGTFAVGAQGQFAYDPSLWDIDTQHKRYPVPKFDWVIDPMQYDAGLASAGYNALYANSLNYALGQAASGSAIPFDFPELDATPTALFQYNKDVQWWLYGRNQTTTVALTLPEIENSYTPYQGWWLHKYETFSAMFDDPDGGWQQKTGAVAGGILTVIPAMADMLIKGVYDAPNNAGLAGQKWAQASQLRGHDAGLAYLEGGQYFLAGFQGLGDAATMGASSAARPKLPSGVTAVGQESATVANAGRPGVRIATEGPGSAPQGSSQLLDDIRSSNGTLPVNRGQVTVQEIAGASEAGGREIAYYRDRATGQLYLRELGPQMGDIPEGSRLILHTQPGSMPLSVQPSTFDRAALSTLGQRSSVIVNFEGTYAIRFRPNNAGDGAIHWIGPW